MGVQNQFTGAAALPCPHCAEPVGYGDHVSYCPKNPVNLARVCQRHDGRCNGPGNYVTDHGYGWQCEFHRELEFAACRKNNTWSKVIYLESRIKNLEKELAEVRAQLPDAKAEEVVARQQFEDLYNGKGA